MIPIDVPDFRPATPPEDIHESMTAYLALLDLHELYVCRVLSTRIGPDGDLEAACRKWNLEDIRRRADEEIRYRRKQCAESSPVEAAVGSEERQPLEPCER